MFHGIQPMSTAKVRRNYHPRQQGHEILGTGRRLILLAHVAFVFFPVAGCHKAEEAPPDAVVTVEAATAAEEPITQHMVADAVLAPLAQAAIVPKISAPIRKLYVARGARVRAGELLALLESGDLDAAALENKGNYTQAKAQFATSTKANVPEDDQKAELDLTQAKANLDLQQKIFESRQNLFSQGAIPARDMETARAALVQSQAAYDIAQKRQHLQASVNRDATNQTAQGQLEAAEGKYRGSAANLSYSQIRSPINGVVTDRPLFAGEMATGGQPIITVMDTSSLIAKTHLSQTQAQQLKLGTAAEITAPGLQSPVKGKVSFISPAMDAGSSTIEVWIKVANRGGTLRVGSSVQVALTAETIQNAIVVPTVAIVATPAGKKAVMIIGSDSVAHLHPVETGITDGDKTQIVSGLKVGEQIVATGAYAMDNGTKVKVGSPDAADDAKPDADKAGSDEKPSADAKPAADEKPAANGDTKAPAQPEGKQ